ncbi:MAG: glycosyltransferase family 39 protein [Drouetiella hepatica Uher 2000/2452]|jgi:uncharacterized membrane protein|uniref:Glycosyltransferase family 39 protein n=1 Tax=Drouetiella hepatica Uher 2000/2452 TaxID=904376 RepID=A0A951Q8U6_9CYAN|nr:glycosyltransferase family 39 protein [Drouetiella hepatica Uher 2000/2452]
MEKSSPQSLFGADWRSISNLWRLIIIGCLVLGIALRFVNLEGKVYQHDETFTSLRISGYTEAQAVQNLSQAGVVSLDDIKKYQQYNRETTVNDTIKGLAAEESQLTPLYFILTRFWTGIFGDSIAAIRILSVIGSILALPCMYWLCWELFKSASAGWLGMAILAISPFQILYAQEARPYSLWAATLLLSSAALLRAARVQTKVSWLIYTLTTVLNLYTCLFSIFIVIVHGLYILGIERFRPSRRMLSFAITLGISLLAFLPWILILLSTTEQINHATRWTWTVNNALSLSDLYRQWMYYLSVGFVDTGGQVFPTPLKYFFSLAYWVSRFLVVYGLYLLCRKKLWQAWLFVLLLILVPALGLILPDLIFGGTRFLVPRYMVPLFLGCQIAATYVVARKLPGRGIKHRQQTVWQGITAIMLIAGILSCGLIVQSSTWWNKGISNNNPAIAQIINQAKNPLVISDTGLGDLLSLTHYLKPEVDLLVRPYCYTACQVDPAYRALELSPYLPSIPSGYTDVFLFYARPQPLWQKRLKEAKYYPLEVLAKKDEEWLWRVKQ